MTWMDKLLISVESTESPKRYWYWAGLSAISAVVNNKLYLDKFYYHLYPNLFTVLIGRSGIRKNRPVIMAEDLVQEVDNTRIISGRASIQAIIKDLRSSFTRESGGPPITDAIAFLSLPEFASFLVQDPSALTILTDLYDCKKRWTYSTNSGGKQVLENTCITLLGASNEVHFKDVVPDNALGGGFIGRTCIIYATKKGKANPLTSKPKHGLDIKELAKHLREISKLRGQFIWSHEGKDIYDKWYEKLDGSGLEDSTGSLLRIHDNILKVAMCISLSRGVDLTLTGPDIQEAIFACQEFIPGVRRVAMSSGGSSASAPGTAVFLRELLSRKDDDYGWSRRGMGQKHWNYFDMAELDRIAESLKSMKAIREELIEYGDGKVELWYFLEPETIANYEKMSGEK